MAETNPWGRIGVRDSSMVFDEGSWPCSEDLRAGYLRHLLDELGGQRECVRAMEREGKVSSAAYDHVLYAAEDPIRALGKG